MQIKLVKRNQQEVKAKEAARPASKADMFVTAQSWVEEFKARKADSHAAFHNLIKQNG